MPDAAGETRAERNARFKQAHKTPDPPDLPEEVEHVWQWFWELSAQRQSGPEPISWEGISRWAGLKGNSPTSEEIDMILAMDGAFRSAVRDALKGASKPTATGAKPAKQFKPIK